MDRNSIMRLAREAAAEEELVRFRLKPELLAEAVIAALAEHDVAMAVSDQHRMAASISPAIKSIDLAVKRSRKIWEQMDAVERDAVLRFVSADYVGDEVGD